MTCKLVWFSESHYGDGEAWFVKDVKSAARTQGTGPAVGVFKQWPHEIQCFIPKRASPEDWHIIIAWLEFDQPPTKAEIAEWGPTLMAMVQVRYGEYLNEES